MFLLLDLHLDGLAVNLDCQGLAVLNPNRERLAVFDFDRERRTVVTNRGLFP